MSRQKAKNDPFAKRETQKYGTPVASREFIAHHLKQAGKPLSFSKLRQLLSIKEEQTEAFSRRLRAMERDGQIIRNRRGDYGLPVKMDLLKGRVLAHRDGYGFFVPDDSSADVFLSERQMRALFHGDRALIRITGIDRKNRREGALVEVLERNTHEITGRLSVEHGVAFIKPSGKHIHRDILIPPDSLGEAKSGQMVVVQLVEQPGKHQLPVGRIVEVLGEHMAPGMEIDVAIRDHNLPHQWSQAVKDEIAPLDAQAVFTKKQLKGRSDFRDLPLVTIDGEDSKDFDDAVYCEQKGKDWRLLVAIADVSAYVKPGTALDEEAQKRGTSVYFPEQVIPMLPEVLSNGLCSLNPQVDRLCMVCEMHITKDGSIKTIQFHQGVMRSAARLTYTQVAETLTGNKQSVEKTLFTPLKNLYALYKIFRKCRNKRGAIDFESHETRIVFGQQRKIEKIVPQERNEAHKLIEEMMLAANVSTAKWLQEHQIPFLYRNHKGPTDEKLEQLTSFLNELGLKLRSKGKPKASNYAKLLEQVANRPDRHLIQTVLLRSLQMAVYSPENNGHFGLSYDSYTHFTSPIRRYPDLLVHRAIRHCLQGKAVEKFPYSMENMQSLGEQCSMAERRADEAVWDVLGWLKCEYMLDKIGEVYDGLVTGVTAFGLFIELNDIFVEGLVHVTSLRNDYYHFDPVGQRLTGERSGTVYRLSDKLRVKVIRVNLEDKKIDFETV